jgi:CRP-like cAMP-binding protein
MKSFIDEFAIGAFLLPAELEMLQSGIISKQVAKGQVLLKKGELNGKTYFVKRGCLRSYSVDEKGKEHIFMFAPEGWIISANESLLPNTPAELFIDAIEASEIEVFGREFMARFEKAPTVPRPVFAKLVKRVAVLQRRIIMLMSATALERYEDFLATYPEMAQRVPQKMIASYLGITPEALSKIRRGLTKGH